MNSKREGKRKILSYNDILIKVFMQWLDAVSCKSTRTIDLENVVHYCRLLALV